MAQATKQAIFESMTSIEVTAGQTIIEQGDPDAKTFYVLAMGTCEVLLQKDEWGSQPRQVLMYQSGRYMNTPSKGCWSSPYKAFLYKMPCSNAFRFLYLLPAWQTSQYTCIVSHGDEGVGPAGQEMLLQIGKWADTCSVVSCESSSCHD